MKQNKTKVMKEKINSKKEQQIEAMSNEEVLFELKEKSLLTFGTAAERKDRLKKHFGIHDIQFLSICLGIQMSSISVNDSTQKESASNIFGSQNFSITSSKKLSCLEEIERLKINREERRKKMDSLKKQKTERELMNEAIGIKVDVDFQVMVESNMRNVQQMQPHIPADKLKISVIVKKRPIFKTELASGEIDCVSSSNPSIIVHECRYKVDAITKYIENSEFVFDNAFGHDETNEELYLFSIKPIVDLAFNQGIVTVFAYGQTGSGKTFTMNGLQEYAIKDLFDKGVTYFQKYQRNFTVTVAMYEIYGGKIYDLLNNHEVLKILEDKNNKIQVAGLKEQFVQSEEEILNLINFGNSVRTTHATKANDTSSRSHCICQIKVHEEGVKNPGKILLVDLAGSERAQECQSNNKDRQQEGAEINKSLLALKECVRAIDAQKGQAQQGQHVPFRQCKLTMVLRDSFLQGEKNKIIMLACICPGSSSADHTLNTLRYAERLKDRTSNYPQFSTAMITPNTAVQNALFPQQLDEQLKLFKKQNSLKKLGTEQIYEPSAPKYKKTQTSLDQTPKESQLKTSKDVFYPQKHNKSQSSSGEDQSEEAMIIENPAHRKAKIIKNESPEVAKKTSQFKKQQDQQQKSSGGQTGTGIVLKRDQTKLLQNKYQQQLKLNQDKQDDSFASDEGPDMDMRKNMSPKNNKAIMPKVHQSNSNLNGKKIMQPQGLPKENHLRNNSSQNTNLPYNGYQTQQKQDDDAMLGSDDERITAEETILNGHLECVKEEAQLITQEGELITKIERAMVSDVNYDMKGYLHMAESIAKKKLEMYSKLLQNINEFKNRFGDEL